MVTTTRRNVAKAVKATSAVPKVVDQRPTYTCHLCHKVLTSERFFLKHKCKRMEREAEVKTPEGQAAWYYYTLWIRAQRRVPPSANTFTESKYFRTFIEFVKFSQRVNLPAPEKFIWYMVHRGFTPVMWRSDEVYALYMEYIDRQMPPLEQLSLSIDVLSKRADKAEVDISDVFNTFEVPELIHCVRTRQLSPWLLLFSKKFKQVLVEVATDEQRIIMENLIRPEYWIACMQEQPTVIPTIKMLVSEMGI